MDVHVRPERAAGQDRVGMTTTVRTREPQQERSRARVRALLAAAEHILEADGYDGLAVARLAREAGVPVGTFYQFFEDKDAIVEVLAQRYVDRTAALINDLIGAIPRIRPGSRLAFAYEAFVDLYRANPAYGAIRGGAYTSPGLRRADNANVSAAVEGVRRLLVTGTRVVDSAEAASAARTLQLVLDALLYRTSEIRRRDVEAFVAEAKSMLTLLERDAIKRLRTHD